MPAEADLERLTQCISFVGKAAEWKQQAALIHAAVDIEKAFPQLALLCVGTGPNGELQKLKDLCALLELKNTFLLGARGQDVLADIYTVFVECMACKTPVIGANSGGPKDIVKAGLVGNL